MPDNVPRDEGSEHLARIWYVSPVRLRCLLSVLLLAGLLHAQDPSELQGRIKELESATTLDEAQRQKGIGALREALGFLRVRDEAHKRRDEAREAAGSAPGRVQELRQELAQPAVEPTRPPVAPLRELEVELIKEKAAVEAQRKEQQRLEQELDGRAARRQRLPELQAQARQRLEKIADERKAIEAGDDPTPVKQARLLRASSEESSLAAEIEALEQELLGFETRGELLRLLREQVQRTLTWQQKRLAQLDELTTTQRETEAKRAAETAEQQRRAAIFDDPALRDFAAENARLANLRTGPDGVAARFTTASRELDAKKRLLDELEADFRALSAQIEKAGRSDTVGLLLQKKRQDLGTKVPLRAIRRELPRSEEEMAEAQLQRFSWDERSAAAPAALQALLAAGADRPGAAEFTQRANELGRLRAETLAALSTDWERHFHKLFDLVTVEQQLLTLAERYFDFIDERVLWLPSTTPIFRTSWVASWEELAWLADPGAWRTLGRGLITDAQEMPLIPFALLLCLGLLGRLRSRARSRIDSLGEVAAQGTAIAMWPTLETLLWTLTLALRWPFLLGATAVLALRAAGAAETEAARLLGLGISSGCARAAVALGMALACYETVRPGGLADRHLRWPDRALAVVRRELPPLLAVGIPVVFLVAMIETHGIEARRDAILRLVFCLGILALARCLFRVLRRRGGALDEYLARPTSAWFARLHWPWFGLALLSPLSLLGLALFGWFSTAVQLSRRLQQSVWLLLVLVLAHALVVRWLVLAQRRLAMVQLKQQLAAELAKSADAGQPAPVPVETLPDLSAISAQSQQFMRAVGMFAALVGLWWIWVDVLPALGVLRQVSLWGEVTLAGLVLAVVVGALTLAAMRNVPAFLEITLLQKLPVQGGERYAITTIFRYVITIAGLLTAFGLIGIGWAQVQWLAAAASLGLGFGLQEIFANFVSGLILLFERPIRVGDIVTVGDVEGTVTRIRMRATTIVDGDRRELIVPNRDLITGRVFNWTLTDPRSRVRVVVGVAYGTEIELVRRLLLQAAHEHPLVIDAPKPDVVLRGFGESALEFHLLAYVPRRDLTAQVHSELNCAIDAAFRKAGIVIPFPQRELHVHAAPGTTAPRPLPGPLAEARVQRPGG